MADVQPYKPVTKNLDRKRGDTKPYRFVRKVNGAPVDITGFIYVMTGDLSPSPPDDTTKTFQITGTIVDGPNGIFSFVPIPADVDFVGKHFYDISEKDGSSKLLTIVEGFIKFDQDIGKTT